MKHTACRRKHLHIQRGAFAIALCLAMPVMSSPMTGGDIDKDGDGFTPNEGDCCDSTADGCTIPAAVNPAALEFIGNGVDDDCDGFVDEVEAACSENFALNDVDPMHAASTLGLCRVPQGPQDWGVQVASFVRSNGTPRPAPGTSVGLLANFGSNVLPIDGQRMLALSTGTARNPNEPGACGPPSCTTYGLGTPPAGFPQSIASCPALSSNVSDDPALQMTLRAPTNAVGFRLHYRFYAHDWPEFVCTQFNDQMIVLMNPPPPGHPTGNIAFDAQGHPVGVNNQDMTVCDPADIDDYNGTPPDPYCPDGPGDLVGTGFDVSAGATKWRIAQASVSPFQVFSLRLAIMDVGDSSYDSTALFDRFEWILAPSQLVGDSIFVNGFESN